MEMTVAEIGRRAGCSGGTVSRVINNSGYVSSETRQAVLKAMQESGYIPRSPRSSGRPASRQADRTAGTIEVIAFRNHPWENFSMDHGQVNIEPLPDQSEKTVFSDILDHSVGFHRGLLFGIVEECRRLGYKVQLKAAGDLSTREFLAQVNAPDKCGVLLLGETCPHLEEFIKHCRHPLVLVDLLHEGRADMVTADNFMGIQMAFRYLYHLGHRKIGYVAGEQDIPGFIERFNAFKLNMVEAGLTIRENWVCREANHFGKTVETMKGILSQADLPTAVMCCNDLAAFAVIRATDQLGISVPEQLSLIGFDDLEAAALVTPPLTTVRHPVAEVGRESVHRVLARIQMGKNNPLRGCKILVKPELVIRKSTAICAKE
jgi:DNA-binding LacI/PurR family transcriptional regulator